LIVFDSCRRLDATFQRTGFIASHFYDFSRRPDALNAVPVSTLHEITGQRSLRLGGEATLYDFIGKSIETNREMFGLLELPRFEYCSTDVLNGFFDILSVHLNEINASMWTSHCARLVLPDMNKKPAK
jgi:hypothetical protein